MHNDPKHAYVVRVFSSVNVSMEQLWYPVPYHNGSVSFVCAQVYRGDASNPVRQTPQLVSRLRNTGADVDRLNRRFSADTARHKLHAATRPHALALHPLQLRLHHLLVDDVIGHVVVDDVILRAVRPHDLPLLAHVPRHQRPSQQNGGLRAETEVDRGDDDGRRKSTGARCRGCRR